MSTKDLNLAVSLKAAKKEDLAAMLSIYNFYVAQSTATFDTAEQSLEDRISWFGEHQANNLPVIAAWHKMDSGENELLGWASLSQYHRRCAYRSTVEASIYIKDTWRKRGLGKMLVERLLSEGRDRGYHAIVALVCSENSDSTRLLQSLNFRKVGELEEVGRKFDRWLSVTIWQIKL